MPFPRHDTRAVIFGLFGLIALLASLAACGTVSPATSTARSTASIARSTPTVDAQTQAYLDVLNVYYRPLGLAMLNDVQWYLGPSGGFNAPPSPDARAKDLMAQERPLEASIVSEAQALHDHLSVTPPTPLLRDDGYLRQAAKVTVATYTKLIAQIDAQNPQVFVQTYNADGFGNRAQYCEPIKDINALFPNNTQLPLDGGACQLAAPTPTP